MFYRWAKSKARSGPTQNSEITAGSGSTWGDSYSYDGFGNLVAKTVTAGSAPSLSIAVNANNHITGVYGVSYDANGNQTGDAYNAVYTYDPENRLSSHQQASSFQNYGYDAQNKRIFAWPGTLDSVGNVSGYTLNIYAPSGQKLAAYQITILMTGSPIATPNLFFTLATSDRYFGGKRLAPQDRLSSKGDFYPYGEAKSGNNPQDTWSYATYWRDSASGLDYAHNRYYSNAYGRFMTPDPYKASSGHGTGKPGDPQSWNRYAYTRGDPVNRFDPNGTDDSGSGDGGDGGDPNGGDTNSFTCDTSWESDASLVGTPCGIQVPGPYGGMVYINIAAIVAAAEAQAAALAAQQNGPECFAQLKTRPVLNGGAIIDHEAPRERRFVAVEK